jgi:hypothetical protein
MFPQYCAIGPRAAVILAFLASVAAGPPRADEASRPVCDQDRGAGEPPTISSRFDLKDGERAGTTFVQARDRAVQWCVQQSCTVEGHSVARTASIYALAIMNRRYVAGFRCISAAPPVRTAPGEADLTYTLGDPSQIDTVLAKASARCPPDHAKAELVDFQRKSDALVAIFNCQP